MKKISFTFKYKLPPILIGRYPLFEEYQVIFEEYKEQFKLIPKEIASKQDIKRK